MLHIRQSAIYPILLGNFGRNINNQFKSLPNQLKIKYLKRLCWFITLNLCFEKAGYCQSLINRIIPPAADSALCFVLPVSPAEILKSPFGLVYKVSFAKDPPVFVWIRTDGGILVFADSIISKPVLIEKRNFFPFPKWTETGDVRLYVIREIPDHGFLRIALKKQTKLLDDLYICMRHSRQNVESAVQYKSY